MVSAGLWHLDMATIMGGPLLRPRVDFLIDCLQRRWQALHRSNVPATSVRQQQAAAAPQGWQQARGEAGNEGVQEAEEGWGEEAAGEEQGNGPPIKRQRRAGTTAVARAEWQGAADAAKGEAALLPPCSLGPRGTPVASAELPSLEAFWRHYMSTSTPVVISGES